MFARYALPSDDLAGTASSVTGSAEDSGYPAEYLVADDTTGHLNLPSRPAKLTTTTGYFDLAFSSPITVRAAAVIYPRVTSGLSGVTLIGGGGAFTQPITIPTSPQTGDDWMLSPWVEFASAQTYNAWRLNFANASSDPIQVGRLLLLGQLRELETDLRYGLEEQEERSTIEHATEFGVETIFDMYGVRRRCSGEMGLRDDETADLRALWRNARNRVQPWLLIPDADVNDAWFVRFENNAFSRTLETVGFHTLPFSVREVSRGMPWP